MKGLVNKFRAMDPLKKLDAVLAQVEFNHFKVKPLESEGRLRKKSNEFGKTLLIYL